MKNLFKTAAFGMFALASTAFIAGQANARDLTIVGWGLSLIHI